MRNARVLGIIQSFAIFPRTRHNKTGFSFLFESPALFRFINISVLLAFLLTQYIRKRNGKNDYDASNNGLLADT